MSDEQRNDEQRNKVTRREFLAQSTRATLGMSLLGAGGGILTRVAEFSSLRPISTAQVPEGLVTEFLYVDLHGSDNNPGTPSRPLRTIARAASIAVDNNAAGRGTKITINPGTYRESIALEDTGTQTDAPIIFQAQTPGATIVSGSVVWRHWTPEGGGIYSHTWPYRWGLAPNPWPDDVPKLAAICRRREMIFVNGRWMRPVLSYDQLVDGSFFVDESSRIVYLRVPASTNLPTSLVEVALRPQIDGTNGIFQADGQTNLVLRGLTFQHGNTPLDGSAAVINGSANVLVENCRFLLNTWTGLMLLGPGHDLTVRGCVASYNGGSGMGSYNVDKLLVEDTETSHNNWRGAMGGFYDWAMAGVKDSLVHGAVYRRHRSAYNRCRGFWMDTDESNVLLEAAYIHGNYSDGVLVEACQGPITIQNSIICHNGLNGLPDSSGLLAVNAAKLTLKGNIFYANALSQITVSGDEPARNEVDRESGAPLSIPPAENWTMRNNRVVSRYDRDQLLFQWVPGASSWNVFRRSLSSTNNLWYSWVNRNVFRLDITFMDLGGWKAETNQDADSAFRDPNFVAPDTIPPRF